MLVISIESVDGKFHHYQSQSHRDECWIDGYVVVPKEFEKTVFECNGHCELIIEDGVLVNVVPHPEWVPMEVAE